MIRIESLLSARLFLVPQIVAGDRIFFISNLSGRLSLYVMDHGGSVPEPLLPPHIALQNPHLVGGYSYCVFPELGQIVVMIDQDGDENYQPMAIPMEGGFPEPAFGDTFANHRVHLGYCDIEKNILYLSAESRQEQMQEAYQADLKTRSLVKLGQSPWGSFPDGANKAHTKGILIDSYTAGDHTLYLWEQGAGDRRLLYGFPLEERSEGQVVPPNAIGGTQFTPEDRGIVFTTYLFDDKGGLGYLALANPKEAKPVAITGMVHTGVGMIGEFDHLQGDRYVVGYNIDGCSWLYEGTFDEENLTMTLQTVLCGDGTLSGGVLESSRYDKAGDRWALSFSAATEPTQLYTREGTDRRLVRHTRERILGIPDGDLSAGEDASFTSFDGLRVSARLYLPAQTLNYSSPRPLVYYVHGGPQSQERPDFAWFSMPLIQLLTMRGFAVFVPNVRGSTGYGLDYMKRVDHDWGGQDRLDHVHAMTEVLPKDKRIDVKRAAVVGRSYGGYMTLTLAGRHPELWSAACDMFGPYDLFTFLERIPETWRPYFYLALGHPEKDKDFLTDRSPKTHIENMTCPMLVIQGANDPRVVEAESRDLVEHLRKKGKDIELLVFEDEGHDVIKYENRVRCYNAITDFFVQHLQP